MNSISNFVSRGFTGQIQWIIKNNVHSYYQQNLLMVNGAIYSKLFNISHISNHRQYTLLRNHNMIRIDEPNSQVYYLEMFDVKYYNTLKRNQQKYMNQYNKWYYLNDSIVIDILYNINMNRLPYQMIYDSHFIEIDNNNQGSDSYNILNKLSYNIK